MKCQGPCSLVNKLANKNLQIWAAHKAAKVIKFTNTLYYNLPYNTHTVSLLSRWPAGSKVIALLFCEKRSFSGLSCVLKSCQTHLG